MATVTQILDRASRITGLRTTGSEREMALQAINDVYLDILMQVNLSQRTYTHTFGPNKQDYSVEQHNELDFSGVTPPYPTLRDDDIQLPPSLRIMNAVFNSSGSSAAPLVRVQDSELLEYRRGFTAQGHSRIYSMAGNGIMRLWPRPSQGNQLTITYVPLPPELTESEDRPPAFWDEGVWNLSLYDDDRGAESAPRSLPIQFHWNVLLAGVVVQLLDKDQRMEQVTWWQGRYEAGIEKMHTFNAVYGGENETVFNRVRDEFVNYPDQWNRRY